MAASAAASSSVGLPLSPGALGRPRSARPSCEPSDWYVLFVDMAHPCSLRYHMPLWNSYIHYGIMCPTKNEVRHRHTEGGEANGYCSPDHPARRRGGAPVVRRRRCVDHEG